MRGGVGRGVSLLKDALYREPVQRLAERTGVEPLLEAAYGAVLLRSIGYRHAVAVDGVSAEFVVTSVAEYGRIDLLVEEELVLRRFLSDLRDGDVVFDVGANVGLYACLAAAAAAVEVVAFEPHSSNVRKVSRNLAVNDATGLVLQVAAGDADGFQHFDIASDVVGEPGHALVATETGVQMPQYRLDTLVDAGHVPRPSVVKIDVEGAEGQVLRGMGSVLDDVRVVYCEIHDERLDAGADRVAPRELLASRGFAVETLQAGDRTEHVRAVRE